MVLTKRFLLRFFFSFEVIVFALLYLFGAQGLQSLVRLNKENGRLSREVGLLQKEIEELETTVIAWQTDSFYKEKFARESLHMARKGEQVYVTA